MVNSLNVKESRESRIEFLKKQKAPITLNIENLVENKELSMKIAETDMAKYIQKNCEGLDENTTISFSLNEYYSYINISNPKSGGWNSPFQVSVDLENYNRFNLFKDKTNFDDHDAEYKLSTSSMATTIDNECAMDTVLVHAFIVKEMREYKKNPSKNSFFGILNTSLATMFDYINKKHELDNKIYPIQNEIDNIESEILAEITQKENVEVLKVMKENVNSTVYTYNFNELKPKDEHINEQYFKINFFMNHLNIYRDIYSVKITKITKKTVTFQYGMYDAKRLNMDDALEMFKKMREVTEEEIKRGW